MEYSAAILRNKGVQVEVAVLDEGGNLLTNGDGDPKTEQRWVRFDSNAIAELEDVYGNLAEFEQASRATPFKTIRQALAVIWEVDTKAAGRMMLDGQIGSYATAVGAALALANGVDPTQAERLLKIGVKATARQSAERDRQLIAAIEEEEAEMAKAEAEAKKPTKTRPAKAASPGTTGSESGSELDATGTTSGA